LTLTRTDALTRASQLSLSLADRAEEAEALRRLPPSTISDLVDMDLLGMVVPTSLGGHGLGLPALAQTTRILGQGCVASAWTSSFLIMHSWLLGKFPEEARDEFFTSARPWALAPAPLAPTGTMRPVEDGFVVSGRWEWATGVHHAEWVMVHAVQTEPELATRFVVVPVSETTVEDVWHTSGMCATGSDAVVLDDVVVPAHRVLAAEEMMFGGDRIEGDGMSLLPAPQVLALVAAAPALGAAERAVELYRERVAERTLAYSLGEKAVDQPAAQMRLGSVMSELATTRTQWDAAIDELASFAGRGEVPLDRRTALRLAAAATVRGARSIVNTIAEGAGASVYFNSSPFQRIQRDLEVLKGHVIFDWDRTTELAGRVALDLPLKPTDMV